MNDITSESNSNIPLYDIDITPHKILILHSWLFNSPEAINLTLLYFNVLFFMV